MRLPRSPLSIFATLCSLFIPAGAGLTAPVWLMAVGLPLKQATEVGARIFGVTTLAIAALVTAYWLVLKPRLKPWPEAGSTGTDELQTDPKVDHIVHTVVWLLFVVPFVIIILGFIYGQLEKLSLD